MKKTWICITVAAACGLVLSLFHLGHPFSAYKALYNLGASWLSWEGLGFACFCALAFINIFCGSRALALIAALVGAFCLVAQGLTYSPPSIPALNNLLPMALFWLSALAMGTFAMRLLPGGSFGPISRLCVFALLLLILAGPAIWVSGTTTMRESAALWGTSPWFWIGVALLALAFIGAFFHARLNAKLQLICLICGIICTRMVFFADTAHTAANLGLPFN